MVRFTLRQCAYFRAVAEHGGVAQAARALNISQPSVAQALAKLEDVTALRLFDRHHARGATLTAQGRVFLRHVAALEAQAAQVAREAQALAAETAGEIRLGCFTTLAPFYVAGLIRSHAAAYPGVRIRSSEGQLTPLAEAVREGSLDVALTYDLGPDLDGLEVTPLASIRPMVVIAADHPLGARSSVRIAELSREPYVMFEGAGSRSYFEGVLAAHGVAPRVAYASASLEAVRSAVGAGLGFTLLGVRPRRDETYDGAPLTLMRIEDDVEPLRVVLAARREQRPDALVRRFVEHAARRAD